MGDHIERTEAARPYYDNNPYTLSASLPPPPPTDWRKHRRSGKVWRTLLSVALLAFGTILGVLAYPVASEYYSHHSATPTPTTFVPFALSTSQVTATPTKAAKATDVHTIMADLRRAGIQAAQVQYGILNCGNDYQGLQGDVCFRDAGMCNLQCGEDSVWIGVFDTGQDAQDVYYQWVQEGGGPNPIPLILGHCVASGIMTGTYAKVILLDCR